MPRPSAAGRGAQRRRPTFETGYSTLGIRAAGLIPLGNDMVLIPRATVAWQHAFNGVTPLVRSRSAAPAAVHCRGRSDRARQPARRSRSRSRDRAQRHARCLLSASSPTPSRTMAPRASSAGGSSPDFWRDEHAERGAARPGESPIIGLGMKLRSHRCLARLWDCAATRRTRPYVGHSGLNDPQRRSRASSERGHEIASHRSQL